MEKKSKNNAVKSGIFIAVFVLSIMILGVSVSYAYFSANIVGSSDTDENQVGNFNVTTTLTSGGTIHATSLAIIDGSEYLTKAESIGFTVTNTAESTVRAKYAIHLTDITISKNILSKYFKWAIVVNSDTSHAITGDFQDTSLVAEGTSDTTTVTIDSKVLVSEEEALELDIGATDTLTFYLWLENDDSVDQLYLTNGNMTAKLSLDAFPVR